MSNESIVPVFGTFDRDTGTLKGVGPLGVPYTPLNGGGGGGSGSVGTFIDTAALQTAFPAAANLGKFANVGATAPYAQYTSNGQAWVAVGTGTALTISTATPQALGTATAGTVGQVSDAGHTHAMPTIQSLVNYAGANLAAENTSIANGLASAAAGGVAVAWRTITANASNAVPVVIDRSLGVNVYLAGLVDSTQVVQVPTNMADGQEMQINLVGSASFASGSWTPWSSASPTTPGYYFKAGSAPTATGSTNTCVPIYVKRRGAKYICSIDDQETV